MATVPSGWAYWDKSANKRIVAGGTIPTPAEGDQYFGITSSGAVDYSKLSYIYYNSETRNYINQNSGVQQTTFTLPAGWHVTNENYTMTSATVTSSIGGKNVVAVKIYDNTTSKISSLSLPSTVVMVWLNNNSNLTTITGSLGSALKEFFCYSSPKLKSVSTLANATNLTNCNYIFNRCTALTTIPALPPNAVSLYYAFHLCTSLTSIPTIPSKVKDMAYLCEGCTALTEAPSNNSAIVLYMQRAFANCTNLTDASNFSIPNTVEQGWELFRNCSKLTQIPTTVSGTNANYNGIFRECSLLNTVPTFSGSIVQLLHAFRECVSLTTPPIIKNILNCEMGYMFYGCTSLTTIPVLPKTMLSAYYMFYNCTSLVWASVIIPAHSNPPSINYMFAGCSNLTGVIWKKGNYNNAHNNTFLDTVQPIILAGENIYSAGPPLAATANNHNVYIGLNTTISESGIARCDATGTLDDEGNYAKLTIKFNCPYLPNSKIYVPKVYIKNAQQQPIQNWTLTYVNNSDETIVKTITNSTDITQEHIEANDLITSGTFETIFNAVDDSVYTIYIPTSCSQVAQDYDTDGNYVISTYYWNGTGGQAVFTGDTYIFDALPDGSCFKIGGPIIENNGDTGFIVGNEVSLLSAQYKSTFNGPVTINSTMSNLGTTIKKHNTFSSINAIKIIDENDGDLLTIDWNGNLTLPTGNVEGIGLKLNYNSTNSNTNAISVVNGTSNALTVDWNGAITIPTYRSSSWVTQRDNALLKFLPDSTTTLNASMHPYISMKTESGDWSIATYSSNRLYFSYVTDTDYNNETNTQTSFLAMGADGYLNVKNGYCVSGSPLITVKTVTSSATTIAANRVTRIQTTFTLEAPYKRVVGIRQITTNHNIATVISGFGADGDGAVGNTVTVFADCRNLQTGSAISDEKVTFEVVLSAN